MNTFLFAMFVGSALTLMSPGVRAELKLVSTQEVAAEPSYTKLVTGNETPLWVSVTERTVRIQPFFDDAASGGRPFDIADGPGVVTLAPVNTAVGDTALLGALTPQGQWSLLQLSLSGRKVLRQPVIESLESITQVGAIGKAFFVAGMSKSQRATLLVLDSALGVSKAVELPAAAGATVTSVGVNAGAVYVATSSLSAPPKITLYKLSDQFVVQGSRTIEGGAPQLSVSNGAIAVSYSSGEGVFVETMSADLKMNWRLQAYARSRGSSLFNPIVATSNGWVVVGANKNGLTVVRIDKDGQSAKASSEDRSKLLPPAQGYAVAARADTVHIRGFARPASQDAAGRGTVFHFSEK